MFETTVYSFAITLILVMDPLGNIPVFLSILKKYDARTQNRIIIRETLIAFIVLVIFLFCGRYIMKGLSITAPALSISGGIILFLIAIRMIFPNKALAMMDDQAEEPLIVPLAIPLTAGPSAIAVLMLFATHEPHHLGTLFFGVLISCIFFGVVMLLSRHLLRVMGQRGLIAIERLMGMVLTTISIQMLLSGIVQYFKH